MIRRKHGWILCSNSLPEEGRPVLLQYENYGKTSMQVTYRIGVTLWAGLPRGIDPVAWQDTPELYKED